MPVAGAVRIFLVAAGYAGASGETMTALLGPAPWNWAAVLARGAVWGVGLTLLAGAGVAWGRAARARRTADRPRSA